MTPFELGILLHYYTRASEHPVVHENPAIWPETREWFLAEQLLEVRADGYDATYGYGATYQTTGRAKVYIEHILALPLPTWQMPKA